MKYYNKKRNGIFKTNFVYFSLFIENSTRKLIMKESFTSIHQNKTNILRIYYAKFIILKTTYVIHIMSVRDHDC